MGSISQLINPLALTIVLQNKSCSAWCLVRPLIRLIIRPQFSPPQLKTQPRKETDSVILLLIHPAALSLSFHPQPFWLFHLIHPCPRYYSGFRFLLPPPSITAYCTLSSSSSLTLVCCAEIDTTEHRANDLTQNISQLRDNLREPIRQVIKPTIATHKFASFGIHDSLTNPIRILP